MSVLFIPHEVSMLPCPWQEACQLCSPTPLRGEGEEKVSDGSRLDSYLHSSLLQPCELPGTSPRVVDCVAA